MKMQPGFPTYEAGVIINKISHRARAVTKVYCQAEQHLALSTHFPTLLHHAERTFCQEGNYSLLWKVVLLKNTYLLLLAEYALILLMKD